MNDLTPSREQRTAALEGMGCKRKRVEDIRFTQGRGNYVDDVKLPGMLHGDFVRSPHAHARVKSIDDSEADLAHDLRVLVRDRLKAGDSNDEVVTYIRARYGDFVLLRPPFEVSTWLLWGGPLLLLLIGLWGIGRYLRRQAGISAPPPLSPDEEWRLAHILEHGADPGETAR